MRLGFLVLALALGFGCSASAQVIEYTCTMKKVPNPGYLAQKMDLVVDLDYWRAKVEDSVAKKAIGRAASADVVSQNDRRFTLSWILDNLPEDPREYHFARTPKRFFRMTVLANGDATLTSKSNRGNYSNSYETVGTCLRSKS
jgi:hypothetical protein